MKFRTLIFRSLRFHWRGHLGVLLGAAVGSASLIGALVVGDSVRLSLRELALQRLGWIDAAMELGDRLVAGTYYNGTFSIQLTNEALGPITVQQRKAFAVLQTPGTISRQDGTARANHVNVLGISSSSFLVTDGSTVYGAPGGRVILNKPLAQQLNAKPGDELILRVHRPSTLSREAFVSPQSEASASLRLKVYEMTNANQFAEFSLQQNQSPAMNAFVDRAELNRALGFTNKANLLLGGAFEHGPTSRLASWLNGRGQLGKTALRFLNWLGFARTEPVPVSPTATAEVLNRLVPADMVFEAAGLTVTQPEQSIFELRTSRVFLDPPVVRSATNLQVSGLKGTTTVPILTYLVNAIRAGTNLTPYSMITAVGKPYTPVDFNDDEIVINEWLAEDLGVRPGSEIELNYFLADSAAQLIERTNKFRVRVIVPLEGIHADRSLMPDFPGIAKAETTHDWDAGFPLTHKIRPKDDTYWSKHRGTPKGFITLAAGQKMWANRFGELTAIRWLASNGSTESQALTSLRQQLVRSVPALDLGLEFRPVRAQALAGASQSQDFGGLFIGFSFFLILAALILMALMFQFGIEQRLAEIGTFLALGFTPAQVRRLLLGEGIAVTFVGGLIGIVGGVAYANAMLYGLTTLWRDAVGTSALQFHATPVTLVIGLFASVVVCAVTIWIVLRKQARRPARELLADGADLESQITNRKSPTRGVARWIAIGFGGTALAMIGWAVVSGDSASAGLFFGAGALLLVAELAAVAVLLAKLDRSEAGQRLSVSAMGLRNCTRRRSRSLASVALLACGSFLVAAIGANRLDAGRDTTKRSSGTGGFALFGESTLPVVRDLNTQSGREFFSLDDGAMKGVSVVPFRVRDGDDASCLNLNRAQTPRLLGVKPELLAERKAFTFAKALYGLPADHPWSMLSKEKGRLRKSAGNIPESDDAIPAIGDAASIQWALGKKLGDTIEFTDERGQKFKVRLVAGVANSILQGSLIIDEAEFTKRFPGESGHRMFLIDTPSNTRADVDKVSAALSRAMQDVGLELTPTSQRLAAFNAVQNTYLNTFQVLGGLGLLLGSAGLGVVVLRNVLERRGELGLLQAVGFRRRTLQWLVLSEHAGLLWLGLGVGMTAALAAVLPALLAPGAEVHYVALVATLGAVFVSGLAWTWFATQMALRGELLKALRNE